LQQIQNVKYAIHTPAENGNSSLEAYYPEAKNRLLYDKLCSYDNVRR
jgi:hypothetical protein